jgi:hypothetical protein
LIGHVPWHVWACPRRTAASLRNAYAACERAVEESLAAGSSVPPHVLALAPAVGGAAARSWGGRKELGRAQGAGAAARSWGGRKELGRAQEAQTRSVRKDSVPSFMLSPRLRAAKTAATTR